MSHWKQASRYKASVLSAVLILFFLQMAAIRCH